MVESGPIDRRYPTLSVCIVVYDPFHTQFIRLPLIVCIIAIEGENQTLL